MEELKKEIKKMLAEKFGYKERDFHLVMAGPIASRIGAVSNSEAMAKRIFQKLLEVETIPSEIRQSGVNSVCNFLKEYDYEKIKETLIRAANLV